MKDVVRVENLSKHYGSLRAVDGISFEVVKGEILGFLGPNGAGKSTTIRCMMGFNKPSSGVVSIFGHNMETHAAIAKKEIGYLPGNVKLYDKWTGWDHIKFFEAARGKSAIVDDLIKRFDFNPNAKFRHLSSGNRQKLGLILALMNEPRLVIMDEPTVGLDPLLQHEIHKVLLELRDNGTSILISSHNLPEVELLCDRVAIIKKGKLVAVENVKSLGEKKMHKVEIRFAEKFKINDFKASNITITQQTSDSLVLTVNGDLNNILAKIAKYKVVDLEINHAQLEDVFMQFYEKVKK